MGAQGMHDAAVGFACVVDELGQGNLALGLSCGDALGSCVQDAFQAAISAGEVLIAAREHVEREIPVDVAELDFPPRPRTGRVAKLPALLIGAQHLAVATLD